MLSISRLGLLCCLCTFLFSPLTIASHNSCDKMGGIQYCDSSAGRYVCNNGRYSSGYCKRTAVMDMQAFKGCCMWQGGVLKYDELSGLLICNNGGVSEICSLGIEEEKVAAW
ncbi:MAG: neurogenic locus notch [Legionella sp.]|nr:neurogenic locus notch [Legionella sp.]